MSTSLRVRTPRACNDSISADPTGLRLVILRNQGIVVLRAYGEVDAFNADDSVPGSGGLRIWRGSRVVINESW